ncbi:helicase [Rhodococcus sp. Leaf7]|uniref:HelD family protein n=1 Tax=unclassified Rhodococcus (in: high G+C Gram-positive bacteria) TaxID=192944 RepID=UPI0006F2692C|nr:MULTISPECIES: 3'-5' exonuclease [unclassified Rhodococcus (in: high G+C Gram-positive bacteria)]KQU06179.1 helicase [Rhodococcus sp. Leaf7]KQU41695.1 helicase [Rhodococcus sp. Leaf247]
MPDQGTSTHAQDTDLDVEQQRVTLLYDRLDALRDYAKNRLSAVLLQTGGTPQARSERESFSALYNDDIAKYDASENGLCFGRIDVEDDASRYIGRVGILDEDNDYESLLYDWRAPMARPFYLATPAAPEGVVRRRHIRTRSRRVTGVADEYLDLTTAQRAGVDTGSDGVAGESALLAALNAARTGQMNDIVETIQREQDDIIRSTHRSVLVVQGGPGTGKTAVALHRAAYLLYTYRQQLDKSGVLIIGPNSTFLDYIGQVLPSLGETGVLLSTIGDLYPGIDSSREDTARAAELKGSLTIVDVLTAAVRDRQELPAEPLHVDFDTYTLRIDKKMATRARGRARSSRRPHNLARPIFVSTMVDLLADQFAAIVGGDVLDGSNLLSRDDIADIRDEMRENTELMAAVGGLWPELTAQDVLAGLLASPERLRTAAPRLSPDDRAALERSDDGRFSAADAPLLDELAELLGIDDAAEREREQKKWRAQIEDAQGALDILTGSAPQDLEDELDPEILMAYDLIDADRLAQRQGHGRRLTAAERAAGDRTWTYGHVIVDEAQELSEMAWRMVMRRIPNRWMTLVGDVAQTGDPAGASSWQDVLGPYVAQRWKLSELTVNYRTPAAIMEIAHRVLAELDPTASIPRSVRDNGEIPRADHVADKDVPAAVQRRVDVHPRPGMSAVLAPAELVPSLSHLESESVRVSTVRDAKGLEFDSVLLVEPARIVSESSRGLNDLYVALTRATQRLDIVHSSPLPTVLGPITTFDQ